MASAFLFAYQQLNSPESVHGFVLKDYKTFPEFNAKAYLYEHKKHGCPFLHIESNDNHNFFSTSFRTTCIDNSGSTHVLEHLALQGSENFPINSVFTELIKRSFATFMNAFTSIEWTSYPFSTTNYRDFFNIMNVYLDATYHPRLTPVTFMSEAHRLEFEDPNNGSTSLKHSGVVYNEMNGDISNPISRFSNLVREYLYPDSLFRFQYGGNPKDIAKLTLQDIKRMHQRYYHPCNSLFFHYGSFSKEEIMKKINDVIDPFSTSHIAISDSMINQPKWKEPRFVEEEGPSDGDQNKVRASVSWMVGDLRNISDIVDLEFLSLLLAGSSLSPLYKGLIKTGLGSKFIDTGYHSFVRSPYFSIGLEGVDGTNVTLNATILSIMNKVYEEGFDPDQIRSIIHQQEISQREVSSEQGLKLWQQTISSWIHNVNPFDLLDLPWEIERIKTTLELQPKYFEMIMKKKLIENSHRLDLIMRGVKGYQESLSVQTKIDLEKMKNSMSESQKQIIVNHSKEIRANIDSPKPLHLLPSISIDDINKSITPVSYDLSDDVYVFEQPVNGLIYLRINAELPLDADCIEDLPLLSSVITSLGAGDLSEDSFENSKQLNTGGISSHYEIHTSLTDQNKIRAFLTISGKSLVRNFPTLLSLMKKIILSPHLNNSEKIGVLSQMMVSGFSEDIADNGHLYALKHSAAGLSRVTALKEMWDGVTYNQRLQRAVIKGDWKAISQRLQRVYQYMFRRANFTASIHCDKTESKTALQQISLFINELNEKSISPLDHPSDNIADFMKEINKNQNTLLELDSSTFFCALSIKGPIYNSSSSSARFIASSLIKSELLHDSIREKLGAYGVISRYDKDSGVTSFVSYRDTSPVQVLKAYDDALSQVASGNISWDQINRTIIQVFSKIDSPISPSNRGLDYFYDQVTNEELQRRRSSILNIKPDDVVKEAQMMLKEEKRSSIVGNSATSTKPNGFYVIPVIVPQ